MWSGHPTRVWTLAGEGRGKQGGGKGGASWGFRRHCHEGWNPRAPGSTARLERP